MKKGSCTVHLSLRKIELFNLLHRHLLPGPQLECLRPLVQQHIESVESRTSGFSGKAQQFCLFRIVDRTALSYRKPDFVCLYGKRTDR